MRRTRQAISTAVLLLTVAVSGCGSSETNPNAAALAKLRPTTKTVAVPFTSPAVRAGKLPASYTCEGKNVSPPLTWGAVPRGLHELALFAIALKPGGAGRTTASVEWALAGVSPSVHRLVAGEIPRGAFVLTTSDGKRRYSICPPRGQTERYEFALYALPEQVRVGPEISGPALLGNLTGRIPQGRAPAEGVFAASYTRP